MFKRRRNELLLLFSKAITGNLTKQELLSTPGPGEPVWTILMDLTDSPEHRLNGEKYPNMEACKKAHPDTMFITLDLK
jgi:hypothetical protein